MDVSNKQTAANRANAAKSTGPVSIAGKTASAGNATRHGLFSERILIDGENPKEFDALVDDLNATLSPVGALELALVEKVALTMWRQRRLANAEAATIRLRRRLPKVAKAVSSEMDRGLSDFKSGDLLPFDPVQIKWCGIVLDEADKLDAIDLATLELSAPHIFKQLSEDVERDSDSVEQHLSHYDNGLTDYIDELLRWCRKELRKADERPTVLAVAEQVRARSQVMAPRELELLSRYQTTLDNQLYKAMRALRDAQEWRLKTLEMSLVTTTVSKAS